MSISLHLTLKKFFNVFRLIAPFFMCGMLIWSPNALVVLILLVFFAPLLLTWLVPVDCARMGCTGRMQVTSERVSFWRERLHYKCELCNDENQAEIFNPNIVITGEYS